MINKKKQYVYFVSTYKVSNYAPHDMSENCFEIPHRYIIKDPYLALIIIP